jgi:hypothetical protein
MADRKVSLEIDVKRGASFDAPLKQMADQAKEASKSMEVLSRSATFKSGLGGNGIDQMLKKIVEFDKALKESGKAGKLVSETLRTGFGTTVKTLNMSEVAARKLRQEMERLNREERQNEGAGGGKGGRGGKGMGGLGGALLGRMGGPLGIMMAIGKAGDMGMKAHKDSYNAFGHGSSDRFWEGMGEGAAGYTDYVPILGQAVRADMLGKDKDNRTQNMKEAQRNAQLNMQRAALEAQQGSREFGLDTASASARAQASLGAWQQRAEASNLVGSTRAQEAAQAGAGQTRGYGRAEEQADIARQAGAGQQLRRVDIQSARELGDLAAKRGVTQQREAKLEEEVAAATKRVANGKKEVSDLGLDNERWAERSAKYEAAIVELQTKQQQLQEAKNQRLQIEQQTQQAIVAAGQARLNVLQQQYQAVSQIVQQEKARQQTLRENFGLMKPMDRKASLGIARKIAAGQNLTGAELEYAKGHGDLFGDSLKKIGAKNAGPEYDEISRLLGLGERQQRAEGERVKLEQQIKVQIDMNAKAVASQLEEQILPKIYESMEQVKAAFLAALAKAQNEMWRNRAAANGK